MLSICYVTSTSIFLLIRPPPSSTLFPSRRSSDLLVSGVLMGSVFPVVEMGKSSELGLGPDAIGRSEEHTSELQSQSNLVCRLLLEKKKKKTSSTIVCIVVR